MAKIVLASHNQGKLRELREILRGRIDGLNVETDVVDASAVHAPDVPETGVSFAENSLIKARAIAEATGLIAVADDSGLSVDVLGGAPGIFSARWSGVHGDDTANLNLRNSAAPLPWPCRKLTAGMRPSNTGNCPGCSCTPRRVTVGSGTTRSCSLQNLTAITPSTAATMPGNRVHKYRPRLKTP